MNGCLINYIILWCSLFFRMRSREKRYHLLLASNHSLVNRLFVSSNWKIVRRVFLHASLKLPPHADRGAVTLSVFKVPYRAFHTHIAYMQAHERARQSPKNSHHSRAVVSLSFCWPPGSASTHIQMSHTNADTPVESVVNRALPAFHFCSKSIGLCKTQHLLEARKVTDYWIVTYCIEGCLRLHFKYVALLAYEKQLGHQSLFHPASEQGHLKQKQNRKKKCFSADLLRKTWPPKIIMNNNELATFNWRLVID